MSNLLLKERPHIRFNRLTGEWGKVEETAADDHKQEADPRSNPLCPGSVRNGQTNPMYDSTFVFDNDFPALIEDAKVDAKGISDNDPGDSLLVSLPASGKCKVICYHPDSATTMPLMSVDEVERVVDCWIRETRLLSQTFRWVQLFENRGELMGCSNSHPHCQIWASSFLPNEARKEDEQQRVYYRRNSRPLLQDYVRHELQVGGDESRVVIQNEEWAVIVPYWACWPFETLVLPKQPFHTLPEVSDSAKRALAHILQSLTTVYDNLFQTSFPFSMGVHGAPSDDKFADHWIVHLHFYPPLLRSATIRKHMVGYELLAQAQRDITPEIAAQRLRECSSTVHYTRKQ